MPFSEASTWEFKELELLMSPTRNHKRKQIKANLKKKINFESQKLKAEAYFAF